MWPLCIESVWLVGICSKNLCFALTIVLLADSWCDFPTQFDQCVTNYYNLSFHEHGCVFMQSELYSNFRMAYWFYLFYWPRPSVIHSNITSVWNWKPKLFRLLNYLELSALTAPLITRIQILLVYTQVSVAVLSPIKGARLWTQTFYVQMRMTVGQNFSNR